MLSVQPRDVGSDVGLGAVALEEFLHPCPRIGKQQLVDELDGRRRALDIQQDGADVLQLDTVLSGMYVWPMQTGW